MGSYIHSIAICLFINFLNKNVQPQFEDYAHVCRELHMCAFVYSNSTVELMIGE